MSLAINLRIKVFYFQMEIMQEQLYLQKKGLPYSLTHVRKRLQQLTADLYFQSNLRVINACYVQHPFRLSIVMSGTEYKLAEAVLTEQVSNVCLESITVHALELINCMTKGVKHKILKEGYTLDEIAKEIVLRIWQLKYKNSSAFKAAFGYLSSQIDTFKLQSIRFDSTGAVIQDISLFSKS